MHRTRCLSLAVAPPCPAVPAQGAAGRVMYNTLNVFAPAQVSKSCLESGPMPQQVPCIPLCHRAWCRGGNVDTVEEQVPLGDPTMTCRSSPQSLPSHCPWPLQVLLCGVPGRVAFPWSPEANPCSWFAGFLGCFSAELK